MIEKLRQLNDFLPELLLGILASGFVFEVIFIWFVKNKIYFSLGLLLGVLLAVFMAWHMAFSLNKAMDYADENAAKRVQRHYLVRYLIVIVVFVSAAVSKLVNPLAVFLGIMTLKVAAYIEPITNKFFRR